MNIPRFLKGGGENKSINFYLRSQVILFLFFVIFNLVTLIIMLFNNYTIFIITLGIDIILSIISMILYIINIYIIKNTFKWNMINEGIVFIILLYTFILRIIHVSYK